MFRGDGFLWRGLSALWMGASPNVDQVLTRIWNDESRAFCSALKCLIILDFLVAGAGFEPATFRL